MRAGQKFIVAAVAIGAMTAATIVPAAAKCQRLAFSVNDYGIEGPKRDAKRLLDKYIAEWTAERGIKNYRTGKKKVTCELFIDVLVFDEHTCRAEATFCWSGAAGASTNKKVAKTKPETADVDTADADVEQKPVKKTVAKAKPADTPTAKPEPASEAVKAAAPKPVVEPEAPQIEAKVEEKPAPKTKPVADVAKAAPKPAAPPKSTPSNVAAEIDGDISDPANDVAEVAEPDLKPSATANESTVSKPKSVVSGYE